MKQQVEYIVVSWRQVSILLKRCFSQIINILKQTKKGFFDLVCSTGSLEGCESFWFLKELVTKMGSFYGNNVLISEKFLSGNSFQLHELVNVCHLDNTNCRLQAPVLNIFFRNMYLKRNILFTLSGVYPRVNFYTKHIGNSVNVILRGKHWVCGQFQKENFPLLVSSTKALQFPYTNFIWKD